MFPLVSPAPRPCGLSTSAILLWAVLSLAATPAPSAVPESLDSTRLEEAFPEYACGPTSVYVAARLVGRDVSWKEIAASVGPTQQGEHTLLQVADSARRCGMHVLGCSLTAETLRAVKPPAIVQWQLPGPSSVSTRHFVVAADWNDRGVLVIDPPSPVSEVPWPVFERLWSGNTLLCASDPAAIAPIERRLSSQKTVHIAARIFSAVVIAAVVVLLGRATLRIAGIAPLNGAQRRPGLAINLWNLLGRGLSRLGSRRALAIAGVFFFTTALTRQPWQPKLSTSDVVVDLGASAPGRRDVQIPLHNVGWVPLKIAGVDSSCSCAEVKAPNRIAPRSTQPLTVSLNVRPGRQSAEIRIRSNSRAGNHALKLFFLGTERPSLDPPRLQWTGEHPGQPVTRTIRVVYAAGPGTPHPRFLAIEPSSAAMVVHPVNDVRAVHSEAISLGARVLGTLPVDVALHLAPNELHFEGRIQFDVEFAGTRSELILPVAARFQPRIYAEPSQLAFTSGGLADTKPARRRLRVFGVTSSETWSVADCPAWIQVLPIHSGGSFQEWDVTLHSAPPPGYATTELVLRTDRPETRQLTIPIHTLVSAADRP